jgi:multidrug efflux pump subunit AcrB
MKATIEFFVKYKIFANVIILIILGFGLFSLLKLKHSSFPLVPSTNVIANVIYPGASPQEVEEGIILKIEQGLEGIEGVKKVTSVSSENLGSVNVEVYGSYDIDKMVTEVKNAVDQISSFPTGAEKPIVYKRPSLSPVAVMVLQGSATLLNLKKYADIVQDELLQDPLMSQVEVTGIPDLEISVEVPELVLRRYKLTFDDIASAIRVNNSDISAGSIKSDDEEILIRSNSKVYEAAEMEDIVLRSRADGSQIRLGEIATITEQFVDSPIKLLYNGNNAIGITINKLQSEDILKIKARLVEYIDDFNLNHPDAQLEITTDFSKNLIDRRNLLLNNGGTGLFLVLIVLGLFLSLKLSGWVAFGIPFSFAGMFIAYSLMGGTINLISLFGMILVIGILVDDGIVIAENVYAHFERGKSPMRASIDGASEILPSVFVSVMTTMMLFSIFFVAEGFFGTVTQTIATVVILTLLFSLIEAVLVLPSHLAERSVLETTKERSKNIIVRFFTAIRDNFEKFINFLRDKVYGNLLKVVIRNRYIFGLIPIIFVALVMAAMAGQHIKFTFFPQIPSDNVSIGVVFAAGTRENVTEAKLKEMTTKVLSINDFYKKEYNIYPMVENIQANIGSGAGESGSNVGSLTASLIDSKKRGKITDTEIAQKMAQAIGKLPEAQKLIVGGGGNRFGMPISYSLRSTDFEQIKGFSEELKAILKADTELKDVVDNNVIGTREVNIELKPKAYALGLTRQGIARQIRQGFFGEEVQRLQKGKNELRVWVRYTADDRKSIGKLEEMRIKTQQGQEFPLKDLVNYDIDRSIVSINHLDGGREIRVDADIINIGVPVPAKLAKLEQDVFPKLYQKYPAVTATQQGQAQETAELRANIIPAFLMVFIGMLLLIALIFRSFGQAFLMLPMIIVGVFCAVLGHGIEDVLQGARIVPVSILSIFGILALIGVIVNDTVIFLNKFNLLIAEGYNMKKAVFEAGIARFRAIVLTSITTVVGLYPIILEQSFQAEFLKPLAISMAYGVLFGTTFILVSFPAYILIANDMRRGMTFLIKGIWKKAEEVEPAYVEKKRLAELEE